MEAKTQKRKWYKPNLTLIFEIAREYAETVLVLIFIFNSVATFLILSKLAPNISDRWQLVIGSVSFAFGIVALVKFTNHGVKHQLKATKGKK